MLKGGDLGGWRNFLRTQSQMGWANSSSRGLDPGQIRDVSMGHSGGDPAVFFTLSDGGRYFAPLAQLNVSDAKAIHRFIESSSMSGPNMGLLSEMWDFFGEEESSRWGGVPSSGRESSRGGRGLEYTSRSAERESASERPQRKGWADEGKKGMFEWRDKGEEIDPKIDRMVMGWIRENPSYIQDILAGMYGLAGSNQDLQGQVRAAREAALEAAEGYPARKDPKLIGRKIESFTPNEKNFFAFRQAILNEIPDLLKKERKRGAHDRADWWVIVADKVEAIGA